MSSFFNSTGRVLVKSKLPTGATREQGIAMLHDTNFVINCGPNLDKYELIEKDLANPAVPMKTLGPTSVYNVVDIMENLPKGIWNSNIESKYEFTNIERGVFMRIRSPMSITMDAVWEIRDAEDGDGLEVVEEADITCSRLLLGLVKSSCENGAMKIHAKMQDRLTSEVQKSSGNGDTA